MTTSSPYYGDSAVMRTPPPDLPSLLLKLTSDISGILITVDYNLSQVALVQEIKVLNLSDLVLAVRPEVQPGEKLNLKVVREGKEKSQ